MESEKSTALWLTRRRVVAAMMVAATAFTQHARADVFPRRLIRLLVPFLGGSATDVEARFFAEKVSATLNQKVIVENKPGVSRNLGASEAAHAASDGFTLYLATNSTHSANVHLYSKLLFDPVADFAPVARLTRNALMMVVAKDFPAQDVAAFLTYAKANPGKLSYGTGSTAAAQLVKSTAGIDAVKVSYQGSPAAITDLLGGRIEFVITDVAVTREFIEQGSLREQGVTTPVPSLPNVPTVSEAGLSGYDFAAGSGLLAPKGTPDAVAQVLNKTFTQAMITPEAEKFFAGTLLEPGTSRSDGLAAHVKTQTDLWGRIIKESGLVKI
jgi:tripartite-type tricarboxylate transporter receptor subunit TctC